MNARYPAIACGYGIEEEIIAKLPPGKYTLIRDDDAAEAGMESCWYAYAYVSHDKAVEHYAKEGGTVSYAKEVEK